MRFFALLASATSLFTLTAGRITGFSAPSTIVPGAPIQIHLRAENYIQRVQDVAVAFGITPTEQHHPRSLGTFMGEKFLGPENSNIVGNITANVSVPTSRPEGSATITAALFSLYGVSLTGSVEYFAVNVTVGNETSSEYVVSEYEPVPVFGSRWRA
ncbi:hypothetical protein MBLNU13_g07991t1 [Cladosporium sp. NU13]